jgi:hypothetical protein
MPAVRRCALESAVEVLAARGISVGISGLSLGAQTSDKCATAMHFDVQPLQEISKLAQLVGDKKF